MTSTTDTTAARIAAIELLFDDEGGEYDAVIVPVADGKWLIAELKAARAELQRIAACEPAHRDRVLRVLSGRGEVGA